MALWHCVALGLALWHSGTVWHWALWQAGPTSRGDISELEVLIRLLQNCQLGPVSGLFTSPRYNFFGGQSVAFSDDCDSGPSESPNNG